MDRTTKETIVSALHGIFAEANLVVVNRYTGLTVAEATDLRRKMRGEGATFRVIKNRLALRALEGTPYAGLAEYFVGPTAIAYSHDPVAAAKVTAAFAKKSDKLEIVSGGLGDVVLDPDGVKGLASLPSLDELRAKLTGLIQAPSTKLAGVLQAPAGQLARVFSAYGSKEA